MNNSAEHFTRIDNSCYNTIRENFRNTSEKGERFTLKVFVNISLGKWSYGGKI